MLIERRALAAPLVCALLSGTALGTGPTARTVSAHEVGGRAERNGPAAVLVRPRTLIDFRLGSLTIEETAAGSGAPEVGGMASRGWVYTAPLPVLEAELSERRARLRVGQRAISYEPRLDTYLVAVPAGQTADEYARWLLATGDYRSAEPDVFVTIAGTPNDPGYGAAWHHQVMRSEPAWTVVTGLPEIIVAVVDTGIDLDHPDLRVVDGFNAISDLRGSEGGETGDFLGHGTAVAGCAAALGNNGVGVTGIGWNLSVMPVRVTDTGGAPLSRIVEGVLWAADNGASVINSSWTGVTASTVNDAGAYAKERGALLVWAAGNAGSQIGLGEQHDVLVVSGTNQNDTIYGASNFGLMVDVAAPGNTIRTTANGGGTTNVTGTSHAAGVASGLSALVFSANPTLTADDVQDIIRENTDDLGPVGEDLEFGTGRLNSERAIYAAIDFEPRVAAPFVDHFSDPASLNFDSWSPQSTARPAADGPVDLRLGQTLLSRPIRTRRFDNQPLFLDLRVRHRGVESGEKLTVQIAGENGVFETVATVISNGIDSARSIPVEIDYPAAMLSNRARVRITANSNDSGDRWLIDDFSLAPFTGPVFPIEDRFETGTGSPRRWAATTSARIATNLGDASDGRYTLALGPQGSATSLSHTIAHLAGAPELDLSARVALRGVGTNGPAVLEAKAASGQWQTLGTVNASTGFTTVSAGLGDQFRHNAFQIRVRSLATAGEWAVDDVFVGLPASVGDACEGDWNGSGALEIFDLLDFMNDFFAASPACDLDQDNQITVLDLMEYLRRYSVGCPD